MKKAFTKVGAAVGMLLIFLSAGTSDYYVLVLKQKEPENLQLALILGAILIAPYMLQIASSFIRRKVREWLLQN